MSEKDLLFPEKTYGHTADLLTRLEGIISEGALGTAFPEGDAHLFGRSCHPVATDRLEELTGFSCAGLRAGGVLSSRQLAAQAPKLEDLALQLAPVVLAVKGMDHLAVLSRGHHFQLVATDPSEAIALQLIAHRIAEQALVPGLVWFQPQRPTEAPTIARSAIRAFLGDPDQTILSSTPAQEMLFGKERRRIPAWFHFDQPVSGGLRSGLHPAGTTWLAHRRFVSAHLTAALHDAFAAFASVGTAPAPVKTCGAAKAKKVVIAMGVHYARLQAFLDQATEPVMGIGITSWRPFPSDRLAELLKGKQQITVIDYPGYGSFESGPLLAAVRDVLLRTDSRQRPDLIAATATTQLPDRELSILLENMGKHGPLRQQLFLGMDHLSAQPVSPRQEIRLQAIQSAYPQLFEQLPPAAGVPVATDPLPPHTQLGQFADRGGPYANVARFAQEDAPYLRAGKGDAIPLDPVQTVAVSPPATALAAPLEKTRLQMPVFFPEHCTACGDCYVHCPHAAIPPLAISLESLLNRAVELSQKAGNRIRILRPLTRKLAHLGGNWLLDPNHQIDQAGPLLQTAFTLLAPQMNWDGEQLPQAEAELSHLLSVIDDMPIAVTDTLFREAEKREPGSGALFSLAINPEACTGCGRCAEVCQYGALDMLDVEMISDISDYQRLASMPDTPGDTIIRLLHHPEMEPLAALLLSRSYYQTQMGSHPDTGAEARQTAIHHLSAVAETTVQAGFHHQLKRIDDLIGNFRQKIRGTLQDLLPADRFENVLDVLKEEPGKHLRAETLLAGLADNPTVHKSVDTGDLERKIATLQELERLKTRFEEGGTGGGRSRYGLLFGEKAEKDPAFNPFLVPVWHFRPETSAAQLEGFIEAQKRHWLDNVRLLRRAELEYRNKYRPLRDDPALAALNWSDLSDEERQGLPPVMLVLNEAEWAQQRLGDIGRLLQSELPVKIVSLQEQPDPAGGYHHPLLLLAQMNPEILFRQTTIRNDRPYYRALIEFLNATGPAICRLFAPPAIPKGTDWAGYQQLALHTRAIPCISLDPSTSRLPGLQLDDNPSPEQDWVTIAIDEQTNYQLTFADWLFQHPKWQNAFEPVTADQAPPLMPEVLATDQDRPASILVIAPDGTPQTWKTSAEVTALTRKVKTLWNRLQDAAGLNRQVLPQQREAIEQAITEKYEQQLKATKTQYEALIRNQEQQFRSQVREQLISKLKQVVEKKE